MITKLAGESAQLNSQTNPPNPRTTHYNSDQLLQQELCVYFTKALGSAL